MSESDDAGSSPSKGFIELIGRALTDKQLRSELLADPEKKGQEYGLMGKDLEALTHLDPDKFEDAASRMVGRSDWTVKVVVSKSF